MTNTNELKINQSEKIFLTVTDKTIDTAWLEHSFYSNNAALWNGYCNRLCLDTIISWFQELGEQVKSWLPEVNLPTCWELVTGSAIQWGETKIVLIPFETDDFSTFCIPQEWIDIPGWEADYYLAVQLNLEADEEDSWMQILGYTTHRELKKKAVYNPSLRYYSLAKEELIEDLTMLFVARKIVASRKLSVAELPSLNQVESLLDRLSEPEVEIPRLQVDFVKWGALLANETWRHELYKLRLRKAEKEELMHKAINLRNWFKAQFETGWQTVEEIIETFQMQETNLAIELVGVTNFRQEATLKAVPTLIELLENSRDKLTKLQIADLLGRIGIGSQEAIFALTNLVDSSSDRELRRQAAVSLGKIDPNHKLAGVRRGKIIDLGMQFGESHVALIVTIVPENSQETNVHLQVRPTGKTHLPPNLEMSLLNEKKEALLKTESREQDNWMQLELSGEPGDRFIVKLILGETSFSQEFNL
ncbi:DUF1822 family protein [Oscillatoria salina]|uniref:DUF1822 family protein n=1 Tax=Oscillatoria salina TaxID=331517 RepID=UPI0013BAE217|nr:DUF1822 family protein [Oscillatoria salina]MBZ8180950.1 DUF1822 family protein [Oscillatoria salina IIICB1]NET87893.1 DUF1822 family protein [Kamptonema sp. SIO1D9]